MGGSKKITRHRLQAVFDELDTDSSGVLSFKDLKLALRKIDVHGMSARSMKQLWHSIDEDNSGGVSFEEFLKLFLEEAAITDDREVEQELEREIAAEVSHGQVWLDEDKDDAAGADVSAT